MVLTFRITYKAQWGEHLSVEIEGKEEAVLALTTTDGEVWEGCLNLSGYHAGEVMAYRYSVWHNDECIRRERGSCPHIVHFESQTDALYVISDYWRDQPWANYLFSSAFSGDFASAGYATPSVAKSSITLRVLCPTLHQKGQVLAIVGESEALGEWALEKAICFEEVFPNVWHLTLDAFLLTKSLEYKLVALDAQTHALVEWEGGSNRKLYVPELDLGVHYLVAEQELYFPSTAQKVAGTAVPIFALRSENSQGVGDLGDLKQMVDWAVLTHQRALQVLPINDTTITGTWTDSYPYNPISNYALHPMYVDLRQVPQLKDTVKQTEFAKQFRQLNALPEVDYDRVNKLKRDYLLLIFRESGREVLKSEEFKSFMEHAAHWLRPYAAFSYLRDKYGTANFSEWPEYSVYNIQAIDALCQPKSAEYEKIAYYFYIQYLLHVQFLAVSRYAREKRVILKGDIPIGISRNSVEAWMEPFYFNMNGQAGAPPDAFSANGQNWGFPTYNWETMRQDGYLWWKRRFSNMAQYFTAYRIDHILGFFRIWEIPTHSVQGLLGQFSPALPMSEEEINRFGLRFQHDFMTHPFICDEILHRIFGEQDEWVKRTFLMHSHYDVWSLRPEFSTQRAVAAYFNKEGNRVHNATHLRDGVYALINNVLFVEDNKQRGLYHPRIAAQQTLLFERLQSHEKEAFNRLYNHYFYERHTHFWYNCAMQKLPEICSATSMLPCGEDLGMVPDCVPWVMDELQILSLEIERMPKNPHHEFGHVNEYPFRSVCTIGTHDMATARGWWKEDAPTTARYYYNVLGRGGEVPTEAPGWICEEIVQRHLESPSLLCILALQDWLAIDEQLRLPDTEAERINVPAIAQHYWRYRMHISIESLMKQTVFNQRITQLIDNSGRA